MKSPVVALVTTIPETLLFYNGQPEEMRAEGLELVAIAAPGPVLDQFAEINDVTTYPVPMTRRMTPLTDVGSLARLYWTLRRTKPDIVHAATPKAGVLAMVAARAAGTPGTVYHVLGLAEESRTGLKRAFLRASTRIACRLADRVVCVSPSVREALIATGAVDADKAIVLKSGSIRGVDSDNRFNPARFSARERSETRRKYGIPEDAPVVGYVGRFARDKGIIELCDAWQELRTSFPKAHLLMVGFRDNDFPTPPETLERLERDERVHFTGKVSDPESMFAIMDVFVLPSYKEGLPTVALEASAMALPVVTTRVTGSVDSIVNGVTGTLVASRDPKALAKGISTYLADPNLRRKHGDAGRAWMQSDFRAEPLSNAQRDLYFELIRQHHPGLVRERKQTPVAPSFTASPEVATSTE